MADDVLPLTSEEGDDDMSVEEEQATAAASDPSSPGADPAPLRRSKRGHAASKASRGSKRGRTKAKAKEQEDYVDTDEDESDFEPEPSKKKKRPPARAAASRPSRRAASAAVQQPSNQSTLIYKKKTPLTRKAVYVTGRPDKFRNKSIVQDIAKKMGATLAKTASGKVKILIVLPKAPGQGTRDLCTNATERNEAYLIESARMAVTNFPPGLTADEQLDLLIQDVSTQPSSSVSPRIIVSYDCNQMAYPYIIHVSLLFFNRLPRGKRISTYVPVRFGINVPTLVLMQV